MKKAFTQPASSSRGSALLIVLAFLFLLTIITIGFLSRATFERQLSNASFSQGKVDLAGQGAVSAIISDLQTEIKAGSNVGAGTTIPTLASGYYYPNAPATVVPATVGFTSTTGLEDLLKISYRGTTFWPTTNYTAAGPIRASSISTTTTSLNGRSISPARWNKPLLLAPTSATDFTPSASGTLAPDWIYVARDGSNPTTWDSSYEYLPNVSPATTPATGTPGHDPVTQRYAYAIYDEGSTLDLNVAGSPLGGSTPAYSAMQPYKDALSYADLTQLPGISSLSTANQAAFINAIVGWRNFASAKQSPSNKFPSYTLPTATPPALTAFDQNVLFNPGGFLGVNAPISATYGPQNGPYHPGSQNQTDNAFTSRQQLLQFFLQNLGQNTTFTGTVSLSTLVNVLPYLGTFSRDINQPSYAPDPGRPVVLAATSGGNDMAGYTNTAANQNLINPAFLNVTVTSTFTRNDSSPAIVGEPLVKKRFALNRLAWLTYKGPSGPNSYISAGRTIPTSSSASSGDQDIWLLVNQYGIPSRFLAQGTDANILKYFGLVWVKDTTASIGINDQTYKWKYEHGANNTGATPTTSGAPGPIMTLAQVQAAGREPDFFELLKAAVTVGAIAKPGTVSPGGTYSASTATPGFYSNKRDSSVDAYIMQLGANIIAQSNPSQYCPRIIFDDGVTFPGYPQEFRGIEDLPYLYRTHSVAIKTKESNPAETNDGQVQVGTTTAPFTATGSMTTANAGQAYLLEVPEIWNLHTWNPNATVYTGISPIGNGSAGAQGFQITMNSSDPNGIHLATGTQLAFYASVSKGAAAASGPSNVGNYVNGGALPAFDFYPTTSAPTISFDIPSTQTGLGFFREPTILNKPDLTGRASTEAGPPIGSDVTSSISFTTTTGSTVTGYILSTYQSGSFTSPTTDNQKYLGFALAQPGIPTLGGATNPYGLWLSMTAAQAGNDGAGHNYAAGYYQITGLGGGNNAAYITDTGSMTGNQYFTYRMQYKDPIDNTKWDIYDEKFLPLALPKFGEQLTTNIFLGTLTSTGAAISNTTVPWKSEPIDTYGGAPTGSDPCGIECYTGPADPRSNRWSSELTLLGGRAQSFTPETGNPEWEAPVGETQGGTKYWRYVDQTIGVVVTAASDYSEGWSHVCLSPTMGFYNLHNPVYPTVTGSVIMAGNLQLNVTSNYIWTGLSAGSAASSPSQGMYYADSDGVVRRATGGLLAPYLMSTASTPSTPYGLPFTPSTTYSSHVASPTPGWNGNRPVMLHRPFQTVAELGYTFSGTPMKNIDFSMPESGYSALLDVFSINDTNDPNGLVAGKVNLNTRQAAVLQAVLVGAYKDELSSYFGTAVTPNETTMLSTEASALVNDSSYGLLQRTAASNTTAGQGPLRNVSELVGKFVAANYTPTNQVQTSPVAYQAYNLSTPSSSLYSGFSGDLVNITAMQSGHSVPRMDVVQRFHEAAIRPLAANTTCRVWNLMIDVIAQTGRFPSSASDLSSFSVEGERRYWVHVAIDRYTGKVLDEQVEEVKE